MSIWYILPQRPAQHEDPVECALCQFREAAVDASLATIESWLLLAPLETYMQG
jgi:hypothetical protein